MAKIDTYNLSTLLSFEYEAVLLSKNMAISIMMLSCKIKYDKG